MTAYRDGLELDVDTSLTDLADGKLAADEWHRRLTQLGLADLALGPARAVPLASA
jgi:hypothetical protein